MHELKEEFRDIFEKSNDWLEGLFNLVSWLLSAANYFPKVIKPFFVGLTKLSLTDNRTTNGVVEGINNKLKLIKRSAYGFRNFDNFR